jgi:hypothetical protein
MTVTTPLIGTIAEGPVIRTALGVNPSHHFCTRAALLSGLTLEERFQGDTTRLRKGRVRI